ncbi:uncharacterized protein [Excalfactoria chinensis]|uniref:uncharacterized protein n=1 Tax=Excalfactoria chinensis TaxID=46218 RepID=UPI003B3AEE09
MLHSLTKACSQQGTQTAPHRALRLLPSPRRRVPSAPANRPPRQGPRQARTGARRQLCQFTEEQGSKAKAEKARPGQARPGRAAPRRAPGTCGPPESAATAPPLPRWSTFPRVPRAAASPALRRRRAADWPPGAPPPPPPSPSPPPAPLPGSLLSRQAPARQLAAAFSRPPPVPPRGEAPPVRRLLAAVGRPYSCRLMKGYDLSHAKRELRGRGRKSPKLTRRDSHTRMSMHSTTLPTEQDFMS